MWNNVKWLVMVGGVGVVWKMLFGFGVVFVMLVVMLNVMVVG